MTAHAMRTLTRRHEVRAAAARRNYRDVAAVCDPPRKPLLTNGQVRRYVRLSLTNGAPA